MEEAEKRISDGYRPWPVRPPFGEALFYDAIWWNKVNKTFAYFIDLFIHIITTLGLIWMINRPDDPVLIGAQTAIRVALVGIMFPIWSELIFMYYSIQDSIYYKDYETLYQKLLLMLAWLIVAILASYAFIVAW